MSEFDSTPIGDLRRSWEVWSRRLDTFSGTTQPEVAPSEAHTYEALVVCDELVDVEERVVPRGSSAHELQQVLETDNNIQTAVVTLPHPDVASRRLHWVVNRANGDRVQRYLLQEEKMRRRDGSETLGVITHVLPGAGLDEAFVQFEESNMYRTPDHLPFTATVRTLRPSDIETISDEVLFDVGMFTGSLSDVSSVTGSDQAARRIAVTTELQAVLGSISYPGSQQAAA